MHKWLSLSLLVLLVLGNLTSTVLAAPAAQDGTATETVGSTLPATTTPDPTTPAAQTPPAQTASAEPTAEQTQPTATTQPAATTQPVTAEPSESPDITPQPPTVFEVTGIEPRQFSNATGGTVSIYGSGFVPGTVVRLVGHGLIDSAVLNNGAIRAVIMPGLKKKSYSLEIIRPDGSSLVVNNAIKITDPKPTPTATQSSGRTLVYGRPQVLIDSVQVSDDAISPGDPFTITLQLINRGDYTATNVRVSLVSAIAVPVQGSSLRVVDLIAENQTVTLELPLALTQDAPAGFHSLALSLEYGDYVGRTFTSEQSVGINVSDTAAGQPLVLLDAYSTDPTPLSPGDAFTLSITLSNVGESDAEQLLITYGGQNGAGLQPFAILDAGNVKYIPRLAAGDTMEIESRFILDGAAESGVYNLPVSLSFDSPLQAPVNTTHIINLLVSRRPQLQVNFYQPLEPGLIGEPIELPIELVNIGRSAVNVSTAEISGEGMEIQTGSTFVGMLDGGTAVTLDAVVVPQTSGTLEVLVTAHYLDDFNQPQTFESVLTIEVTEPEVEESDSGGADPQNEQEMSLWQRILRVIRGLLGLGS